MHDSKLILKLQKYTRFILYLKPIFILKVAHIFYINPGLGNLFQKIFVEFVTLVNNILQIPLSVGKGVNDGLKNLSKEAPKLLSLEEHVGQKYNENIAFADYEMKQVSEMNEEEKINFILNTLGINLENKESSIIFKGISLLLQGKKLEDLFIGPNKEREIEKSENFLLNLKNWMQRLGIPTTKEELEAFIWEKLSFCILPSELITLYTSYDSKYKNTVEGRRMLIRGLKNINIGAFREGYLFAEMQINNKS